MKKKSEKTKVVQGTSRKDRKKVPPVIKLEAVPEPQKYLNKNAHEIYYQIIRHLQTTDRMRKIDSLLVSAAANCFYLYGVYAKQVARTQTAAIQEYQTGAKAVSAEFTVMKQMSDEIKRYSRILGLDIRSRESIIAFMDESNEKQADPLADLMKQRAK